MRNIFYLLYLLLFLNVVLKVNSLVSGHPWQLEKVSVSRAVCLQELFPYKKGEKLKRGIETVSVSRAVHLEES